MDISVIILTWNSERYVETCLQTLLTTLDTSGLSFELVLVDNGSTDATVSVVNRISSQYQGCLRLIRLPANAGTTRSRNMAFNTSRGRYLCVMDSDIEIRENIFPDLIQVLESEPDVGLVAPGLYYPDGRWQKSWDRFPTVWRKLDRYFNLRNIEVREAADRQLTTQRRDVDYAVSAFWLFRRELLSRVGLLDEHIFYAPEDADYCLRIWKSGYRVVYLPALHAIHHSQELSRGLKIHPAMWHHLKGLAHLFFKHGYLFRTPDVSIQRLFANRGAE